MQLSDTLALVGGLSVLWNLLRLLWRCWRGFRQYILSQFWQVDLRGYGQWAVVTGATSGIGKAYAMELARRGLDIVLVSRSEDKLQTAAKVIEEIYGRKTCTIRVDFTDGHIIYPKIANVLKDLEVGILVNNVGMTYSEHFAYFLETSDAHKKITNIVNCNMLSIAQMSKLVLPHMVKRGHGLIINISSETGVRPHPLVSLYSATKLFVTYFSQCLHAEYKSKGIIVQCVTPLLVSTSMTRHTPVNCFTKSAQGFANEALNTVGYSAYTSGCLSHALQSLTLTVLLPDWLRMSSFFIRQLRKTSDVSPCENNKQKILEKDE
ncbi:hydroxysteroid (20-beta) dehydrogenase 2 [Periophthalmus magnuspinnatus]|uniref:hydroxysteroid (20-beta) dehydrogenase 2 n=1 Tax=Periophthalmus magnuspinnatus TaxID=409849 RepID=UPI0024373910|nr:hydroxysteroid (20-beta) dehydrogenase 2 [Periophthalmus magnuspinnatus]